METVILSIILKRISEAVQTFNGVAHDTDNNKLHNEKTPQLTKDQRQDSLKWKRTFQTSWKEKNSLG